MACAPHRRLEEKKYQMHGRGGAHMNTYTHAHKHTQTCTYTYRLLTTQYPVASRLGPGKAISGRASFLSKPSLCSRQAQVN